MKLTLVMLVLVAINIPSTQATFKKLKKYYDNFEPFFDFFIGKPKHHKKLTNHHHHDKYVQHKEIIREVPVYIPVGHGGYHEAYPHHGGYHHGVYGGFIPEHGGLHGGHEGIYGGHGGLYGGHVGLYGGHGGPYGGHGWLYGGQGGVYGGHGVYGHEGIHEIF